MENKKGRDRPCLLGNRSGLLLVHLVRLLLAFALLLLHLFLVAFLLVHLGLLLHLLLVLRSLRVGTWRGEGGSGHGRKHRGDDHGQQLAHFVLLVSVRKRVDATSRALPGPNNAPSAQPLTAGSKSLFLCGRTKAEGPPSAERMISAKAPRSGSLI